MISRSTIGASLIVLLVQLMSEHLNSGLALSISSSNKNGLSNSGNTNGRNNYNQASGASSGANQQHQTPLTTMPPLMTTISHINYLDSLSQQAYQSKQQDNHSSEQTRSNSEDHDDSIPLATINNHSRNSQPLSRPPQYVDVAALVGRERNSTSSQATSSLGASSLAAKSRSGLPECATQQVCNAIFVRMNYTQKLCECSSNYNWKCSNNLDPQDGHTIELTRKFDKRIYTQIKTCEPLKEVRACKSPTDWTLLALQSERSGKAHYVVVCKCPTWAQLEGPYTHNHPPYANIPGIRVYGMLCAHQTARSSAQSYATYNPALSIYPEFPWAEALSVLNTTSLISTLDSH